MGKIEKILFNIVISLNVIGGVIFVISGINNTKETQYCGKVVRVYMTPAGYKVHPEKRVVFYCDSLKRNVDVKVTFQTYSNTKEGQRICFDLNRMQLEE